MFLFIFSGALSKLYPLAMFSVQVAFWVGLSVIAQKHK
jgi:hypothetical protein